MTWRVSKDPLNIDTFKIETIVYSELSQSRRIIREDRASLKSIRFRKSVSLLNDSRLYPVWKGPNS